MRDVWKGLTIARELAEAGGRAVREHGPELAHRASETTAATRDRLAHAND